MGGLREPGEAVPGKGAVPYEPAVAKSNCGGRWGGGEGGGWRYRAGSAI